MIKLNTIYNEDCIGENGMCLLPDKSIDMILCDLPYGTTIAKWDSLISFDKLWEQYKRIIKDNGAIVLTASQPFTSKLICSNIDWFKEELIWEKDRASNFANAKYRHLKYHENILIFAKNKYTYNRQMIERKSERMKQMQENNNINFRSSISKRKDNEIVFNTDYAGRSYDVYNAKLKNPSTVIYNPIVNSNSKEKLPHPTQKPVKLFEYLIKTYTNEGDLVLDNCIGSGTTAIACLNTERNYIGFEWSLSEPHDQYFNLAIKRVREHKEKLLSNQ